MTYICRRPSSTRRIARLCLSSTRPASLAVHCPSAWRTITRSWASSGFRSASGSTVVRIVVATTRAPSRSNVLRFSWSSLVPTAVATVSTGDQTSSASPSPCEANSTRSVRLVGPFDADPTGSERDERRDVLIRESAAAGDSVRRGPVGVGREGMRDPHAPAAHIGHPEAIARVPVDHDSARAGVVDGDREVGVADVAARLRVEAEALDLRPMRGRRALGRGGDVEMLARPQEVRIGVAPLVDDRAGVEPDLGRPVEAEDVDLVGVGRVQAGPPGVLRVPELALGRRGRHGRDRLGLELEVAHGHRRLVIGRQRRGDGQRRRRGAGCRRRRGRLGRAEHDERGDDPERDEDDEGDGQQRTAVCQGAPYTCDPGKSRPRVDECSPPGVTRRSGGLQSG